MCARSSTRATLLTSTSVSPDSNFAARIFDQDTARRAVLPSFTVRNRSKVITRNRFRAVCGNLRPLFKLSSAADNA
jgi:hypothetical protein